MSNGILFVFPGQGAQYPGIGSDLFKAHQSVRETYQEASDTLGYDVAQLSFSDPDQNINFTRYTQPVLVTHHIACLRLFNELTGNSVQAQMAAGHSLGEYSALVAAEALTFEQALQLVKKRGELMGELGQGEMEALTLELGDAQTLADEFYCGVAACNLTDQTVVGGLPEDLAALAAAMSERFPRKRSTRLKTEGAFHTYYMVEAAKQFREALQAQTFQSPKLQVASNFSGGFHESNADSIRSRLFMQLFNPVLWVNNLQSAAANNLATVIEFGGGIGKGEGPEEKRANLEGIVKKTFRGHDSPPETFSVINTTSLAAAVAHFA
ncbi:MAG: [acyl-carrier-protein] S-malonyltransferase [Parvicella sp.]|jgi:[acyl-carrier-protein] S-malonyltransferase